MTRRLLLTTIALALAAGAAGAWLARADRTPPALEGVTVLPAPRALPPFELEVGADRRAAASLAGRWTVVFFGFTNCPDVCPTTLALLARASANLAPEVRPRVLFISVDPERDGAGRAAQYATWFDAGFLGATTAELDALAGALGAPFARRPTADGYAMDHSGALFLLDPEVRFAAVATPPLDAQRLARDLARLAAGRG